jgi:hypothetical protein
MIVKPTALWELHPRHHPEAAAQLARELGAPVAFGQVLLNRGILDLEQAHRFLDPRLDHLHDPFRMKGWRRRSRGSARPSTGARRIWSLPMIAWLRRRDARLGLSAA